MNSILNRAIGALAGSAVVAFAALCMLPAAHAADTGSYPNHPIRIIVPFSPGGAVDGPTRVIAQGTRRSASASRSSSRTSPAPARRSAADIVAKAPPDGYTLLLASQTNAISATLYSKLPFDPIEDFAPISLIGREPGVLVVNPALPVKTLPGVHRLREGASGQDRLRVVGQRQRPAPVRRAARVDDRHEAEARALPRQRPGDDRPARRAGADVDSRDRRHGRPHQGRQAARARGHRRARARRSCPTCRPSMESGVPGYEAYVWMGLLAPEGHAAADHRQAPPRTGRGRSRATRSSTTWRASASRSSARRPPSSARISVPRRTCGRRSIRETGAKID